MNVDEFVQARVLPELHPVIAMNTRTDAGDCPGSNRGNKLWKPVYKGRKIFAVISPTKKDITFSFTHGGEFEDKYGLLRGTGKLAKHVKIKNLQSVNKDSLHYYIRQDLEYDAK